MTYNCALWSTVLISRGHVYSGYHKLILPSDIPALDSSV
jgi:hypothetical protein